MSKFVKIDGLLVNANMIRSVDLSLLSRGLVHVNYAPDSGYAGAPRPVRGAEAIDLIMTLKPSALEGTRLKWLRRAWMVHNLIGHPGMQLLALFRQYDWAMRLHEMTVPRPKTP